MEKYHHFLKDIKQQN